MAPAARKYIEIYEIYKNLWKTYIRAKVSMGAACCFLGCFNTITQISENPRKNHEIYENLWKTYIRAKVSIGAAGCFLGCFNTMTQISENPAKNHGIYKNLWKTYIRAKVSTLTVWPKSLKITEKTMKSMKIYEKLTFEQRFLEIFEICEKLGNYGIGPSSHRIIECWRGRRQRR